MWWLGGRLNEILWIKCLLGDCHTVKAQFSFLFVLVYHIVALVSERLRLSSLSLFAWVSFLPRRWSVNREPGACKWSWPWCSSCCWCSQGTFMGTTSRITGVPMGSLRELYISRCLEADVQPRSLLPLKAQGRRDDYLQRWGQWALVVPHNEGWRLWGAWRAAQG